MRLLLDTCTFLWIAAGSTQLSKRAVQMFSEPANEVFLSAASAWEIAVKHGLGRLPLPAPAADYIVGLRDRHGIAPLPISEEALYLPSMLVCQAIVNSLALLTPDPLISQYSIRIIW